MNKLYKKLQDARIDLQEMEIKKTGKNRSFKYYELSDILPAINVLCDKYELFTKFDIEVVGKTEMAKLIILDMEGEDDWMEFFVPTAEANLPAGQPIQNLGAKITYLRRYLLMNAFEIVESDMVDFLKRETADDVSEEDIERISGSEDFDELTNVCAELKEKYKVALIKPYYDDKKEEFEKVQEETDKKEDK